MSTESILRLRRGILGIAVVVPFLLTPLAHADTATSTTSGDITICGRPGTNSFNSCYYQGQNFDTFKVQRNDGGTLNFDWDGGSPDPLIQADHFSDRHLGLFNFDPGTYEFTVTSDDGVRLNVDNQTIVDQWHDQPATTYTARINLSGQRGVIVEHYENAGDAVLKVSWQKVSDTGTTTPPTTQTTFYPNAFPSSWYLLPGQQLSFTGNHFPPNDTLQIQGGGNTYTAHSDGSGNFSASNVLTIPFSWQNTQQSFTVKAMSDGMSTPNPITVQIGTFYPQLNPSSWWIGFNQGTSASVTGFAPGEQVKFSVNGNQVGQQAADGSGNTTFSFTTPGSGGSATLTAQGQSSGISVSQTIYLHS